MIGEFNLSGVFVSSMLVSAMTALLLAVVGRRLLAWTGAYRYIWHPALFDTAVFLIVWAFLIALPTLVLPWN